MSSADRVLDALAAIFEARDLLAKLPEAELQRRVEALLASSDGGATVSVARAATPPPVASSSASETGNAPGEAEPEEAPEDPIQALSAVVVAVREGLESKGLLVEPALAGFTEKASQVFGDLADEGLGGTRGRSVLLSCLRHLDGLAGAYSFGANARAAAAVIDPARALIASALSEHCGVQALPGETLTTLAEVRQSWSVAAGVDDADLEVREIPCSKPEGALVSILRRGLVTSEGVSEAPAVEVSIGHEPEMAVLMSEAYRVAESIDGARLEPAARNARGDALGKLRDLIRASSADEGDAMREASSARYALGSLDLVTAQARSDGVERLLARPAEALVSSLEQRGFFELPVDVGDEFDESFSPSKFERRLVSSAESEGTIVAVVRRGFQNADGVCVQQAILSVSRGS